MARRNWTRDETLMAFTLYYLLPSKMVDKSGADIINLAKAIGRTPSSVALKAWNIAAYDANRVARGRVGMTHGSRLDVQIWEEFAEKGDELIDEGVRLLGSTIDQNIASPQIRYAVVDLVPEGEERKVHRRVRVNQQYFRNNLMANYKEKCCLTGLAITQLLVASHIKPWRDSDPKTERLVASNGLLLNAFHDKAFDKGLMTLSKNCEVILSPKLVRNDITSEWLFKYEGQRITMPSAMPPSPIFIEYHQDMVFQH